MTHLGPQGRYLLGGALGIGLYAVVPDGNLRTALFVAIGFSAVAAIVFGIRNNRPDPRGPWVWFAAGVAANVTGKVVESLLLWREVSAWPSVADPFYLALYPCVVFGLILVIRERTRHGDHASLLDAGIISTGLGLLTWVFLLQPLATEPSPWLERLVSFAYPVGDILVLAILIRLLASAGVRSASFYLMTASLGLFLLGDFGWATINHIPDFEPDWLLSRVMDEVFLCAYVLFGASALVPSMADVGRRSEAPALGLSQTRLVLLMVATLVAPGLLAIEAARGSITDAFAIAFSSVALFTFVVLRMALLVRQLEAQTRLLDSLARVDSLTGVSNRRVLDEQLPTELERARRQGTTLVVAMLDLDNFKTYNDCNGHEAGDHLLQSMVAVWQSKLRAVDTLVRYGGDEFVVILPAADRAQALAIATRLGSANESGQTMSIGVADWDGEESADKLLYRADHCLFDAKRAGRDRIVMAEPARIPSPA